MDIFNKRLDLTDSEFDCLNRYIDFEKLKKDIESFDSEYYKIWNIQESSASTLLKKLQNPKEIKRSPKKAIASFKATESRSKKAKEKIQNAINILRITNEKITHYSISKCSGVSFTTVKKYLDEDTINTLNEIQ